MRWAIAANADMAMTHWLIPVENKLSHSKPSSTSGSRRIWHGSRSRDESRRTITVPTVALHLFAGLAAVLISACGGGNAGTQPPQAEVIDETLVAHGKQIFRFDTFGDESQ